MYHEHIEGTRSSLLFPLVWIIRKEVPVNTAELKSIRTHKGLEV